MEISNDISWSELGRCKCMNRYFSGRQFITLLALCMVQQTLILREVKTRYE